MSINAHRIPSLNGIRAVSVLIVMIAHAGLGHLVPGGFGVTVFFFLSGFLITTLLLAERDKYNTINLKQFYIRRFLRLSPPLLITLAIIYGVTALGYNDGGISLQGTVAQLLYFTNYFHIFFQDPGELPSGSTILWSLAVEEHFYMVYPIVFLVGFKFLDRRKFAMLMAATCALVMAWRCVLVLVYGVEEVRTYCGTDTRIDSIAYGCLLAVAYNPIDKHDSNFTDMAMRHWLALGAGVAVIVGTMLYRDSTFRETVGYSLQGLALMPLFYLAVAKYQSALMKPLSWSVLEKIGVYSYSLYLIHYFALKAYAFNVEQKTLIGIVVALALSFVYAWMMDEWVDKPVAALRKKFRR